MAIGGITYLVGLFTMASLSQGTCTSRQQKSEVAYEQSLLAPVLDTAQTPAEERHQLHTVAQEDVQVHRQAAGNCLAI